MRHRPAAIWALLCLFGPALTHAQTRLEERYGSEFFTPPPPPVNPFQLPKPGARQRLPYQYAYGLESEATYRRDADLERNRRDNETIVKPQLNGIVTYRPTNWLETTLELALEREIAVHEEATLPSTTSRRFQLPVVQAFVTARRAGDPASLSIGRHNFEDERHWLYDTSMDMFGANYRSGPWRAEFSFGREIWKDMDLAPNSRQVKDAVDTYMLYGDYRGFESVRFAAYSIVRDDRSGVEGRAVTSGVRVLSLPVGAFTYWGELAGMSGHDASGDRLRGYAVDVGGTYRFLRVPLRPNFTLAYAMGSGDNTPGDGRNTEFRQTGLQSNESRFGGVSLFNVYGETLAPELSNLKIATAAVGFRPTPTTSLDFVYHRYWLHRITEENRGFAVTAPMNQVQDQEGRDVGKALDVVLGLRHVFGIRRLGVDLRAGFFNPGAAFRRNLGSDENPELREADRAFAVVMKLFL